MATSLETEDKVHDLKATEVKQSQAVANLVRKMLTEKSVSLIYEELTEEEWQCIFEALKQSKTIQTLDLRSCHIGLDGAALLSDSLKINSTLTSLYLAFNYIEELGAVALADAMKTNSTLTSLNLQGNDIGDQGAVALADAMKINSTLTSLDLQGNNIGDQGAVALADAMKINSTLTSLDLYCNNIGDQGAVALADAMKINSTLKSLNLGCNNIGHQGAVALADAMKINSTLTSLNLQVNSIGDQGAVALADAMKINSTLTSLNLAWNGIGHQEAVALADAMKINSTLTSLNLESNSIRDQGAVALADAMKINSTLTSLNLALNSIGHQGAVALADAMKINSTLTSLSLGFNRIGHQGAVALDEVLKSNHKLTALEFRKQNQTLTKERDAANQQIDQLSQQEALFKQKIIALEESFAKQILKLTQERDDTKQKIIALEAENERFKIIALERFKQDQSSDQLNSFITKINNLSGPEVIQIANVFNINLTGVDPTKLATTNLLAHASFDAFFEEVDDVIFHDSLLRLYSLIKKAQEIDQFPVEHPIAPWIVQPEIASRLAELNYTEEMFIHVDPKLFAVRFTFKVADIKKLQADFIISQTSLPRLIKPAAAEEHANIEALKKQVGQLEADKAKEEMNKLVSNMKELSAAGVLRIASYLKIDLSKIDQSKLNPAQILECSSFRAFYKSIDEDSGSHDVLLRIYSVLKKASDIGMLPTEHRISIWIEKKINETVQALTKAKQNVTTSDAQPQENLHVKKLEDFHAVLLHSAAALGQYTEEMVEYLDPSLAHACLGIKISELQILQFEFIASLTSIPRLIKENIDGPQPPVEDVLPIHVDPLDTFPFFQSQVDHTSDQLNLLAEYIVNSVKDLGLLGEVIPLLARCVAFGQQRTQLDSERIHLAIVKSALSFQFFKDFESQSFKSLSISDAPLVDSQLFKQSLQDCLATKPESLKVTNEPFREWLFALMRRIQSMFSMDSKRWSQVFGSEKIIGQFMETAKQVWALHLLSFTKQAASQLFDISTGMSPQPEYCKSINNEDMNASNRVLCVTFPGFRLGTSIIKCQVLTLSM